MNRGSRYKDKEKLRATNAAQKRRYRLRTGGGYRLSMTWTEAEDRAVLAHSIPDRELAERIGRSVQAIHVRRSRLRG